MENGREGRRGMSATVEREGGGGKREKWVKERKQTKRSERARRGQTAPFIASQAYLLLPRNCWVQF